MPFPPSGSSQSFNQSRVLTQLEEVRPLTISEVPLPGNGLDSTVMTVHPGPTTQTPFSARVQSTLVPVSSPMGFPHFAGTAVPLFHSPVELPPLMSKGVLIAPTPHELELYTDASNFSWDMNKQGGEFDTSLSV